MAALAVDCVVVCFPRHGGMSRTSDGASAGTLSPRTARALPPCGLAFDAIVAHARALAFPSKSQSQNQCRQLGVGLDRNVVPLCTARTRPQDLFCLIPCAGGKRHAPGPGSSSSNAKKPKVQPSYVFTAAMKVSDEQPLPWELVIYCVLLLLQVESQSGKKRRADASEQGATDELENVVFSESVLSRAPGLGRARVSGWACWVESSSVAGVKRRV